MKARAILLIGILFSFLLTGASILIPSLAQAASGMNDAENQVLAIANKCRDQVLGEFEKLLDANVLSESQLFDTFYIPIPNTSPQKYNTQYDKICDAQIQDILDRCLETDKHLVFVVAIDRNGYLPTHNSKYSLPLTSDSDYNTKHNRTKRIFNDRAGLAAAKNTEPFLLQKYERDTGKSFYDLSVPIFINDKHWGALRVGFDQ
jgi:hypothetical protein